jgi:hypothetical protein
MQGDVAVELPANVSFQTESDSLLAFFVIIVQLSPVAKCSHGTLFSQLCFLF